MRACMWGVTSRGWRDKGENGEESSKVFYHRKNKKKR